MRDYDTVLKSLLQSKVPALMDLLGWHGAETGKWLPAGLPTVQNREIDLLFETLDGRLIHIELQSTNDPQMPLRMGEYALGILRKTGKFAEQTVLYVGNEPLRMPDRLVSPNGQLSIAYRIVDFRNLDVSALAESSELSDNILAVLGVLNLMIAAKPSIGFSKGSPARPVASGKRRIVWSNW